MKSHKIALKLYARGNLPAASKFVEVFHDWIKDDALPEQMIDVVDYGHVHRGPIVLFVGHESDYAIDLGEGRPGLLYVRKRVADDAEPMRLPDAVKRLLAAAAKLEADPRLAGLSFDTGEVLLTVLDRLHAPNDEATWNAERAEIEAVFTRAFGAARLTREGTDPREPLTVRVQTDAAEAVAIVAARA